MFADNLKYLRKRAGLTQDELAKSVGVGRSCLSMYELGKREPDFETLEAIADYFNINMSTLLGEDEKAPAISGEGIKLTNTQHRAIELIKSIEDDAVLEIFIAAMERAIEK